MRCSCPHVPCFAHLTLQLTWGGGFQNPSGETLPEYEGTEAHACSCTGVPTEASGASVRRTADSSGKRDLCGGSGPPCLLPHAPTTQGVSQHHCLSFPTCVMAQAILVTRERLRVLRSVTINYKAPTLCKVLYMHYSFFWPHHTACRILVPREVPLHYSYFFNLYFCLCWVLVAAHGVFLCCLRASLWLWRVRSMWAL